MAVLRRRAGGAHRHHPRAHDRPAARRARGTRGDDALRAPGGRRPGRGRRGRRGRCVDDGRMNADARQDGAPGRRAGVTESREAGRHSGRRPGDADTRGAILAAARDEFARGGYDGATIRAIRRRSRRRPGAGAPLLRHQGRALRGGDRAAGLPRGPAAQVLASVERDQVGAIIARRFLAVWEDPDNRPVFMAMLRSVVGNEQAATAGARTGLHASGVRPHRRDPRRFAMRSCAPPRSARSSSAWRWRATWAASNRWPRLPETLVAALGPTIQRYLFGDLGDGRATRRRRGARQM